MSRSDTLFPKNDFGFREIALGLGESAFALHHPGAGPLAQLLYLLRRNLRHFPFPLNYSMLRTGCRTLPPPILLLLNCRGA